MAISKTTACDRCGKEITGSSGVYHALKLRARGRWYEPNDQTVEYSRAIDLCAECKVEFLGFLAVKGREVDVMAW